MKLFVEHNKNRMFRTNPTNFFNPLNIYPKLTINQPNDKYEQEADAMANRVMAMPETSIQRKCHECEKEEGLQTKPDLQKQEEEEEPLQAKFEGLQRQAEPEGEEMVQTKVNNGGLQASPELQSQLNSSKGGGSPMQESTNQFMSHAFGTDFSHVTIHTGNQANQMNQSIQAKAFTQGSDIYFRNGQYNPTTSTGKHLLAHELTHVLQQSSSEIIQRKPSKPTNFVYYSGGHSGFILVVKDGKGIYASGAISGHSGSKEYEKNVGPIPKGKYWIYPRKKRSTVTKIQSGVGGANGIASGYQEITSKDKSPCADPPSHYCTESCPTAGNAGRKCFTPVGVWGEKRMKINGSQTVSTPSGGKVRRSGFYIHGGASSVMVSSGCIKVFDNKVFDAIRKLPKSVRLYVGDYPTK